MVRAMPTRRRVLAAAVALPVLPVAADTDDDGETDGTDVDGTGETVRVGYRTFAGPGDHPPPDAPRFR